MSQCILNCTHHHQKKTNSVSITISEEETLKKDRSHELASLPVILTLGSKVSIFSTRSMADGWTWGNFSVSDCRVWRGSCRMYLFALSFTNPKSASDGVPISCTCETLLLSAIMRTDNQPKAYILRCWNIHRFSVQRAWKKKITLATRIYVYPYA